MTKFTESTPPHLAQKHKTTNAKLTQRSTVMKCLSVVSGLLLVTSSVHAANITNYGENITALQTAFANKSVHILQIGDSHTAGDYFTEQLRKRLQAEIGDGGVGFAYPAQLSGQRTARHGYTSSWKTDSSKTNKWGGDYPLGGVIASPKNQLSKLTLTSQYYAGDTQTADIVVFGNQGQNLILSNDFGRASIQLQQTGWQNISIPVKFPTSIQTSTDVKLGGFWLRKKSTTTGGSGVVSAMGINGATQDYWQRWNSNLAQGLSGSQANLVILAYGTNEAFRGDANNLTSAMNTAIKNIRQGLPHAAILIVGAPESLKSTAGSCGSRATSLDSVQYQLQDIAQKNQTLYWSWQKAMGGSCSMKSWIKQGRAARDGVHFSRSGYTYAANDLYTNLKYLLNSTQNANAYTKGHVNHSNVSQRNTSNNHATSSYMNNSQQSERPQPNVSDATKGQICSVDGRCVRF